MENFIIWIMSTRRRILHTISLMYYSSTGFPVATSTSTYRHVHAYMYCTYEHSTEYSYVYTGTYRYRKVTVLSTRVRTSTVQLYSTSILYNCIQIRVRTRTGVRTGVRTLRRTVATCTSTVLSIYKYSTSSKYYSSTPQVDASICRCTDWWTVLVQYPYSTDLLAKT